MAGNLRIFVSSTCSDLFEERRYLVESFLAQGHDVIVSELGVGFPVSPNLSCISNCLDAIAHQTDLVVLVVSSRYGSGTPTGMSITEEEYLRAVKMRIPVYTFVRRSIWQLIPVYRRDNTADLSPVVDDNRVFALVEKISASENGNWIFPFDGASDIAETVKYQMSAALKAHFEEPRQAMTGDVQYLYTNNTNILLSPSGTCRRSLEYQILNGSAESVRVIHCADRSDTDLEMQDLGLLVHDASGSRLGYEVLIDTPRHKRWDIVFPRPLLPGERFRYFCSWISSDLGHMETGHTRGGAAGFIQAIFPAGTIDRIRDVSLRTNAGWEKNPPGIVLDQNDVFSSVSYHYDFRSAYSRLRVAWD